MPNLVRPKTFLIGYTDVSNDNLIEYLIQTHQGEFCSTYNEAIASGLKPAEALCSFYAKLCYSSLVGGTNENISSVRSIHDNIVATMDHGHMSVFEHFWINFITTNCSRVFTHELVRHRVGTAFSQTSGRYVRVNNMGFVFDPILSPVASEAMDLLEFIEMRYERMSEKMFGDGSCDKCRGRGKWHDDQLPVIGERVVDGVIHPGTRAIVMCTTCNGSGKMPFDRKKKITSALRRFLPDGRANEIGWSANIRTLRHLIMLRTSRHAEWEIRLVFTDVYKQLKEKYPLMFHDAKEQWDDYEGNSLVEVTGMRLQPYETIS